MCVSQANTEYYRKLKIFTVLLRTCYQNPPVNTILNQTHTPPILRTYFSNVSQLYPLMCPFREIFPHPKSIHFTPHSTSFLLPPHITKNILIQCPSFPHSLIPPRVSVFFFFSLRLLLNQGCTNPDYLVPQSPGD